MQKTKFILGMRDRFFDALFEIAKRKDDIVILSADNGAPSLDKFSFELKNQFYTVGIAEQQMIGMAAGLASEGKKVYTYAIAPFVTTRVHEQNKIDICAMQLPVVNLGVGAGYAYDIMGPSHHTVEDITIMRVLPHMEIYSPADGVCAEALALYSYQNPSPQYIRFDRAGLEDLYEKDTFNVSDGYRKIVHGKGICILATGVMVHQALNAVQILKSYSIDATVIDVFRLKPLPEDFLCTELKKYSHIVTYEEHLLNGGFGSSILELLSDHQILLPVLRIGQNDRFVFDNGGREVIWKKYNLDHEAVAQKIINWYPTKRKSIPITSRNESIQLPLG